MSPRSLSTHWGYNEIDGVEFFLEAGKPLPKFCPLSFPDFACPHKTVNEVLPRAPKRLLWCDNNSYEFPTGVEVRDSHLIYTGCSCLKAISKLLYVTNYIPLWVSGIRCDGKQDEFFNLVYNEWVCGIRTLVLSGDDGIALPRYIVRF